MAVGEKPKRGRKSKKSIELEKEIAKTHLDSNKECDELHDSHEKSEEKSEDNSDDKSQDKPEEKIPKKRGRKPKTIEEKGDLPKKRGRKPKEKVYGKESSPVDPVFKSTNFGNQ